MTAATALVGGFADAVFDSQATFRVLMDAMAHPGRVLELPATAEAPGALGPGQAAVALTLIDATTPVLLDRDFDGADVRTWLSFHTGASVTDDAATAAFAFIARGHAVPADLPTGTEDYPDRSATVVIEVAGFGNGERFILSGPGIDGHAEVAVSGLAGGFADRLADNRALFPRGLDFILTAGRDVLALPRSTVFAPLED